MPVTTPSTPINVRFGSSCCCGGGSGTGTSTCACSICSHCQDSVSQLTNITITAASGNVSQYFYCGVSGVSGVGTAGPYSATNPINDPAVEYVGVSGIFELAFTCSGNDVCLTFTNGSGTDPAMIFCDVITSINHHSGSTCPSSGDATITLGTVICDSSGFVSMDFTVDLGSDGSFSGTVFR